MLIIWFLKSQPLSSFVIILFILLIRLKFSLQTDHKLIKNVRLFKIALYYCILSPAQRAAPFISNHLYNSFFSVTKKNYLKFNWIWNSYFFHKINHHALNKHIECLFKIILLFESFLSFRISHFIKLFTISML